MKHGINWVNVGSAVEMYQVHGYRYVEVPWIVSAEAVAVTLPTGAKPLGMGNQGTLVGSAEQAFIQKMLDDTLDFGKRMAATPCFRDDTPDELHQNTFFKVELIECRKTDSKDGWVHAALGNMACHALDFFHSLEGGEDAYIRHTEAGLDIELRGVEIGSYGIRRHRDWVWVYGTGYADPRFSVAVSL